MAARESSIPANLNTPSSAHSSHLHASIYCIFPLEHLYLQLSAGNLRLLQISASASLLHFAHLLDSSARRWLDVLFTAGQAQTQ